MVKAELPAFAALTQTPQTTPCKSLHEAMSYSMEWFGLGETSGDQVESFVRDLSLLSEVAETLGGIRASLLGPAISPGQG